MEPLSYTDRGGDTRWVSVETVFQISLEGVSDKERAALLPGGTDPRSWSALWRQAKAACSQNGAELQVRVTVPGYELSADSSQDLAEPGI
jgi:hypothetical protein